MNINIDTLRYYIEQSNYSVAELCHKIDYLEDILSGEKEPTFTQISNIAQKINIPTGLLLLDKPIKIENKLLEFRTLNSSGIGRMSDELRDVILDMEEKQDFLHQEVENELNFVGQYSIKDDPHQLANVIRKHLNIQKDFMLSIKKYEDMRKFLRNAINDMGVFVFFGGTVGDNTKRTLNPEEFRGFVLSDNKAPIIFVNQRDVLSAQIFTLIHELVHIFIGENELLSNDSSRIIYAKDYTFDKQEAFVNKVTAEILMPGQLFRDEIKKLCAETEDILKIIPELAKKFKASKIAIARRLLDMKFIDKTQYKDYEQNSTDIYRQENQKGYGNNNKKGGSYKKNLQFKFDKNFFYYIKQAIMKNRISYTDAFHIMGVSYKGYKILDEGK